MNYNIIYIMKEKLSELSKAEKKLALWILDNPGEVVSMNVTKLASAANSSPATIVRLCYSLGLNGFTDLKLELSKNLPQIEENLHTDIVKDEDIVQIKKKLKFNLINSFEETYHLLDNQELMKAIQFLESAQTIFTYGIGASGLVSEDLFQKFTRVGKNVFFSKDLHLMSTALVTTPVKSVFIAVSNSGENKGVINLARIAKHKEIPVIVLTSGKDSQLAQFADCLLITSSGNKAPIRSSATNSMMVQLFAADIIFSTYSSKHYEEAVERIAESGKVVKNLN